MNRTLIRLRVPAFSPPILLSAILLAAMAARPAAAGEADDAYDRGMDALDNDDYDLALKHLSEAVRLDPKLAAAWSARGWIRAQQGDLDGAVADYSQALSLDPADAETWCNRGHARAKLGALDKAVEDLDRALRLDPELTEAYHSRGWVYSQLEEHEKAVADYSQALKLGGDDAYLLYDRARCLTELNRPKEAADDLTAAIRLEPHDLRFFGARGAARVRLGDLAGGREDFKTAIGMSPLDAGKDYQPFKKVDLSPEALRHGQQQVRLMIDDRPVMSRYGGLTDFLLQWAARKFAGEDTGVPFYWDPTPPTDSEAENVAPATGRRGLIRVSGTQLFGPQRGAARTFEELWSNAVFELHNIAHGEKFQQLHEQAAAGTVSRRDFVKGIWGHEHAAMQETRAFYVDVFLPWAEKNKVATEPALWFAALWDDAGQTFDGFTDQTQYPWRPYARQYDWYTVHRMYHDGKFRELIAFLEAMGPAEEYPQDLPQIYMLIGRCRLELGEASEAIAPLTKAIELSPRYAEAYRARGEAYQKLGQTDKAEADFAKVRPPRRNRAKDTAPYRGSED